MGELSLASDSFRRLWSRHDVTSLAPGSAVVVHPVVGTMQLRRQKLPIGDTDGHILAMYHAAPNIPSAAALARLRPQRPESSTQQQARTTSA